MTEIPDARTRERVPLAPPPWQRRVASAVVAVVARFLGLGLVFAGGAPVLTGGAGDALFGTADWLNVSAGLALIAISAGTMAVSSLGMFIVGAVEIVVGFFGVVFPYALGTRDMHPVNWPRSVYTSVFPDGAELAGIATASGFLLVLGGVTVASALAHRGRRGSGSRVSQTGRIAAMATAVVLSVPGALLTWAGGYTLIGEYRIFATDDAAAGPVLMVIGGALLCTAIAAAGRLSAAAHYAYGLFWVTMWVAFGVFLSGATTDTAPVIPAWATTTAVLWCVCGFSAVLAVYLLASGVVMRVVALSSRRHVVARADNENDD